MGERLRRGEEMATTSAAVSTIPVETTEEPTERVAVITLRPTKPDRKKKVGWTEDTVDNENMNKKKSKCCCIYEKPKKFGESDSESSDDEECEHCFGHVEKKKHKHHHVGETKAEGESSKTIRIEEKKDDSAPPDKEEPKIDH